LGADRDPAWRRGLATVAAIVVVVVLVGLAWRGAGLFKAAWEMNLAAAPRQAAVQPPSAGVRSIASRSHGPEGPWAAIAARAAWEWPAPRPAPPGPARDKVAAVMSNGFPYRGLVLRAAARHAVDPRLVLAIIASESGGDPAAVSQSGAIGLMQLMPTTALELGVDPWKPEENVEGAVRYLALLIAQFGSVDLALVAYNAGPGFAESYRQGAVDLGAETREFIMRVAGFQ
jgi:soluble lytic murein transglycosylase-like protein